MSTLITTNRFHYKINNSNKTNIRMKCKDKNYHWKLAANKIGQSNAFNITTYNEYHSCSHLFNDQRDKHATYKYVANNIKEFYQDPCKQFSHNHLQKSNCEKK